MATAYSRMVEGLQKRKATKDVSQALWPEFWCLTNKIGQIDPGKRIKYLRRWYKVAVFREDTLASLKEELEASLDVRTALSHDEIRLAPKMLNYREASADLQMDNFVCRNQAHEFMEDAKVCSRCYAPRRKKARQFNPDLTAADLIELRDTRSIDRLTARWNGQDKSLRASLPEWCSPQDLGMTVKQALKHEGISWIYKTFMEGRGRLSLSVGSMTPSGLGQHIRKYGQLIQERNVKLAAKAREGFKQ